MFWFDFKAQRTVCYYIFIFLSYFTLLLFYSALSVLPNLMCLFNVISVITTSSNHTRLVDFNASLLKSPFALMKACCQLAETLVSFLLLQQLSEDYYYLSYWLVLQHLAVKFRYGFTTIREMKCCDKTMDGKMALYRECCFPNCTKSWWKKLLS